MAKKLSVSSQHVKQRRMRNGDIMLTDKLKKELQALKKRPVNLSDKNAAEIEDWSNAEVGKFYRPIKKQITLRLDADMLEWFKHQPGKYQSLINKACREYMLQHQSDLL